MLEIATASPLRTQVPGSVVASQSKPVSGAQRPVLGVIDIRFLRTVAGGCGRPLPLRHLVSSGPSDRSEFEQRRARYSPRRHRARSTSAPCAADPKSSPIPFLTWTMTTSSQGGGESCADALLESENTKSAIRTSITRSRSPTGPRSMQAIPWSGCVDRRHLVNVMLPNDSNEHYSSRSAASHPNGR